MQTSSSASFYLFYLISRAINQCDDDSFIVHPPQCSSFTACNVIPSIKVDADESGRMVGNGGVQHTMDADGKESIGKKERQPHQSQRLVSPVQLASILYHHVMQYGPKPSVNFMTQAMQFFCTHGMDRNAINIITAKPDDATSTSSAPATFPSTHSLLSPDEVHSIATSIYADMARQGVKPDHFMYSIPIFSLSDAIDRFMENDILRGTAGDTRRALVSSSTDLSRHLHRLIALYDLWVKECGAASVIPNVPPRILSLLKYQPFHHLSAAERIFDGYLQHRQQTLQLPPPPGVGVYDMDVRAFNAMLGFWVEHGLVDRCWSLFLLMHAQAHIPTPNLGSSPSSSYSSSSSSSPSSSFTDLASTPMMDGNGNSHQSINGKVVKTTNVQTVTVIPVTCPLPDNVCYMEMMSALLMDEDAIMTHDSSIDTDHELVTTKTPTLHGLLSSSTSLSLPPLPPLTQRPHSAFLLWQELLMRADEGMAAMRLYEQSMKQYRKEVWKLKQQFMKQQQEAKMRTHGSNNRATPLPSLVLPPEPIRPTGVTSLHASNFNLGIHALARADRFDAAVALLDVMRRYALTPNLVQQVALISAANQSGRYEWAIKVMQHHVPNIAHPSAILTASTIAPSAHEYRRASPFIPFYIQALCGLGRIQHAATYILECRRKGHALSLRTLVPFILKVDEILAEREREKKKAEDKQNQLQEKTSRRKKSNDKNASATATTTADQLLSDRAASDLRTFSHHIAYDVLKQYLPLVQSSSTSSLTAPSPSSSFVSSTPNSTASSSHPTDTDSPSSQATTLTHPHHQSCMSMNDHECVQRLRHLLSTIQRCCTQIDAVRTYALTHTDAWNGDGAERSRASDDHNDNDRNAGSNSRASEHRHDISVSVSNSNSGSISNSMSGGDRRRSTRRSIESMIAQRLWQSELVLRTSSLMITEKIERLMNEEYKLHPQIIIEHHHDDSQSTMESNVADPSTSTSTSTSTHNATSTSAPPLSSLLTDAHSTSHYVIHVNPSMLHEWVRRMSEEVELEREIERARQRAGDEEEAMKNDVSSDSRNVMTDRTQNHDSHSSSATSSTVTASSASSSLSPMMNGVDDAVSKKVADDHESSIGMGEHSSIGIESEVDESKSGGKKDDAAGVVTDDSFASRSRATFSSFIQSIRRTRD